MFDLITTSLFWIFLATTLSLAIIYILAIIYQFLK